MHVSERHLVGDPDPLSLVLTNLVCCYLCFRLLLLFILSLQLVGYLNLQKPPVPLGSTLPLMRLSYSVKFFKPFIYVILFYSTFFLFFSLFASFLALELFLYT